MPPAPRATAAGLPTAILPTLISAVCVTWAIAGQRWVQWGVQAMPPRTSARTSFADLANITVTAQCIQDGTEVAACDPYGRPYQPYVVLPARVLAAFGLGPDATGALGVALAALYVLVVAGLGLVLARLWQGRVLHLIGAQVLLGILAVTPPALLAVERGQIEILTLALSVVGLLALSSDRLALGVSGAVAAGAAVATKFFAIGVFAPFLQRGRRNLPALAALAASVALLALNWRDIQLASDAAGADAPATSKSQFGAFALVATFRSADPVDFIPSPAVVAEWPTVKLTGWAVVLVALTMAAVLVRPQQVRDLAGRHRAHALILGSAGVIAVPYVLGSSHDYRLIFLLPLIVGALAWLSARGSAVLPWLLVAGSTISLVTGAAMTPTPGGFLWPKAALVAGDVSLLVVLAVCGGVWIRGLWTVSPQDSSLPR